VSIIDPKDLHLFPEWMHHADEIEATCLSFAAAGLAAELGMVDRELVKKSREAMARLSTPETAPVQQ
jgi:hypothetical protein